MKRFNKILMGILLVVAVLLTLVSCDDKPQPKQLTDLTLPELKDNQMALIIKNGDGDYTSYTVNLDKIDGSELTCEDVLEYLREKSDLTLTWEDGGYGKFLTTVGSISNGGGKYIFLFTSNLDYESPWASATPYELSDDVKLVESSVGVTDLPVAAGDVVYFELGTYNF